MFSSRVQNYLATNILSAWWKNNTQKIAKPCFSLVGFVSCLKCKASSLAEPIKVKVCQTPCPGLSWRYGPSLYHQDVWFVT